MTSILTDEDRATFATPQSRMMAVSQSLLVMVREFGLTQADIETCRAEIRTITDMMRNYHASAPGAGAKIDDIRARCDMLDAVFKYQRRHYADKDGS